LNIVIIKNLLIPNTKKSCLLNLCIHSNFMVINLSTLILSALSPLLIFSSNYCLFIPLV